MPPIRILIVIHCRNYRVGLPALAQKQLKKGGNTTLAGYNEVSKGLLIIQSNLE